MVDTSILNGKTLEELQSTETVKGASNLIEPTSDEVLAVVEKLREGVAHKDIKRTVIREEKSGAKLTLSYSQIKEIEKAWLAKIAELSEE
jgi:uncharacterized protein YqgV (UPF0045/DUF77 family)|tara:strand:- start:89 stop:358 length:270 start_codon:yes stop_codon:yes gene_type:complete